MDYKTYESELYLRHKRDEMEADLKRQYRKLESELKNVRHYSTNDSPDLTRLKAYEVIFTIVIVVGAARLLGLV